MLIILAFIECSQCKLWVHKKSSGLTDRLVADPEFVCQRCQGVACPIDGCLVTHVDVDGTQLDVEATFCYLGDMISAGGGCDRAIAARCCAAWSKFRKLLPILTSKHISFKIRGKVFTACVRSTMLHGSETWAPNASDLQRLRRNDRAMIRWICSAKLADKIPTPEIRNFVFFILTLRPLPSIPAFQTRSLEMHSSTDTRIN